MSLENEDPGLEALARMLIYTWFVSGGHNKICILTQINGYNTMLKKS